MPGSFAAAGPTDLIDKEVNRIIETNHCNQSYITILDFSRDGDTVGFCSIYKHVEKNIVNSIKYFD